MPHDFDKLNIDQKEVLQQWKDAPDYETLIDMNKQYIRGDLCIHAAHSKPVAKETSDVTKGLINLNTFGLMTFQGQPRTKGMIVPTTRHHHHALSHKKVMDASWCRTCAIKLCHPTMFSEIRQTAYIQLVIHIPKATGPEIPRNYISFIHGLMMTKNIHTMVSWPKNVPLPPDFMLKYWKEADLSTALYISEADLDMFKHFKSEHGTSCAHQVRRASCMHRLQKKEWANESSKWSEVNDFHLLRERTPDWLFGPMTATIVVGVNVIDWEDETNLEDLIVFAAKVSGFERRYVSPNDEDSIEELSEEQSRATMAEQAANIFPILR